MPKLEYFVVSEGISVDVLTNRISLFNVIEGVQSKELPILLPQIVATSTWNKEPSDGDNDYQTSLRIYPPGEERPKEFAINFRMEQDRHRIHQTIINLQITQPGELILEVLLNGKHIASHTVSVKKID